MVEGIGRDARQGGCAVEPAHRHATAARHVGVEHLPWNEQAMAVFRRHRRGVFQAAFGENQRAMLQPGLGRWGPGVGPLTVDEIVAALCFARRHPARCGALRRNRLCKAHVDRRKPDIVRHAPPSPDEVERGAAWHGVVAASSCAALQRGAQRDATRWCVLCTPLHCETHIASNPRAPPKPIESERLRYLARFYFCIDLASARREARESPCRRRPVRIVAATTHCGAARPGLAGRASQALPAPRRAALARAV